MFYDTTKNTLVEGGMSGTIGQISWQRLTQALRMSGELRHSEKITGYEVVPDWGLRFRVEIDHG